jgi:hypothetical protein
MPATSKSPGLVNAVTLIEVARGMLVFCVFAAIDGGRIHESGLVPNFVSFCR